MTASEVSHNSADVSSAGPSDVDRFVVAGGVHIEPDRAGAIQPSYGSRRIVAKGCTVVRVLLTVGY
jgi:hypothetical protein